MINWTRFYENIQQEVDQKEYLRNHAPEYSIYTNSIHELNGSILFLVKGEDAKHLIILEESDIFHAFEGQIVVPGKIKMCPLSAGNGDILRKYFPFTSPVSHKSYSLTIGLGDRLGLASPGHIKLIRELPVFPVLAQQSIRELNLTGRSYVEVLDAASWAVFQEDYTKGFGADGDHLKTRAEVQMALDHGYTMITLDCSEYIDNTIPSLNDQEVREKYLQISPEKRKALESKYLNKTFTLSDGFPISFDEDHLMRIILIYVHAIDFTIGLYHELLAPLGNSIDFEMSIDETMTPTTPESHYFTASELLGAGVDITSLAPRFCGEFQKGIDYIGDQYEFEKEFVKHCSIANELGYKLSIHSGSDKFSVFPIIGKESHGKYHLKTAGTNWLEAIRVIASCEPGLYREIHSFALKHIDEAKKYYHIGADIASIPPLNSLTDEQLPGLMDRNDSRQLIHITYGLILQAKDENGSYLFRDRIYRLLWEHEDAYANALIKHIGRHLSSLGISESII